MNKKITRILSVVLSLTMLAGSFLVSTVPASAAPGDTQWFKESLPGKGTTVVMYSGSKVQDIEVADASVIYVANGAKGSDSAIWKSSDAGQSFTALTAYPGGPAQAIAVAPDNTGVLGVVDQGSLIEIITTNAAAWSATGTVTVTYVDQNNNAGNATSALCIQAGTLAGYHADFSLATPGAPNNDTSVIDVTGVATAGLGAGDTFTINCKTTGTTVGTLLYTCTNGAIPTVVDAGANIPGQRVSVSNDAGVTWSVLPALAAGAFARDIAVGPARSGTLLGREYVVALADPGATVALGDLVIIGGTASWATVGGAGVNAVAATYDFTSVVVSPNFIGDRCVVAVGTKVATGTTALIIVNTATNTIVQNTVLLATGTTIDFNVAVPGVNIVTSDIALPSNFDPTSTAGRRAYVCIASAAAAVDNDAYRIDDNTTRALGAVSSAPVRSVAYAGTTDSGKLFMGQSNANSVKFTDNPTTSLPTWTTSTKNPSGFAASGFPMTLVRVAKDYGTTNRVFAGTGNSIKAVAGDQSALSISNDAGVSFNQEAFINSHASDSVVRINGLVLTPDGKTMYMATNDGTYLSLFKSVTPVSGSKWSRVFVVNNAGRGSILAVNPDYANTPCVFLADLTIGGYIYVSQNAGTTFNNRMAPSGVTINPNAMGVQDANTVYIAVTKYVYKSTNGAWTWGDPVDGKQSGNIASISIPRYDDILVGGTNGASYSVDGGTTFTAINTGLSGTGGVFIAADNKYTGNKTIYAAGATNGKAYRYVIGTSAQWDDLLNLNGIFATPSPAIGLVNLQGALYAPYAGTPAQNTQATDRVLNPTEALGTLQWATMNVATAPAPDGVAGVPAGALPQFTAAASATENTLYETTQAAEGLKLVVSSTVAFGGTASGVITVNYVDASGTAQAATATITALAAKDQEFPCTMAAAPGNTAVDVTSVVMPASVAGNKGDKFDIKGVTTGVTFGSADNSAAAGAYSDKSTALAIYAYKDWLAVTPPTLNSPADKYALSVDPVTGRGDALNIAFKKMGSGTGLVQSADIEIREKATGLNGTPTWAAQPVSGDAPSLLVGGWQVVAGVVTPFRANTEYIWQIRAQNTASGDAIPGKWSTPRGFTVQSGGAVVQEEVGPIITSPQGGAMNVDPKLVGFTWAPVYGATEYTVIVATDAALTKAVAGTPVKLTVTSFQATALEYGTTYFYSVQATKPTIGPAKIGSFTTMVKPTTPAPPVTVAPQPTPQIIFPKQETPAYVWAIIVIGAVLIIAVIVLIVRTRRVP